MATRGSTSALPNTRMQRTRSSPSALRSPLMRCPLGGRKNLIVMIALVGALLLGTSGCMGWGDMDPGRNTYRTICSDIQLWNLEIDFFYITDQTNGDKSIAGPVEKIGWGGGYVLAWERSSSDRRPSGWVIVDCKTRSVAGPMSDEEFGSRSVGLNIQVLGAAEAWRRLKQ